MSGRFRHDHTNASVYAGTARTRDATLRVATGDIRDISTGAPSRNGDIRGDCQCVDVATAVSREKHPGRARNAARATGPPIEWATTCGATRPVASIAANTALAADSKENPSETRVPP